MPVSMVLVLVKHCAQGIYMVGDFESDFLEGEEFHALGGLLTRVNIVRNIIPESAPSVAVFVPPLSSIAAVSEALHCCLEKVT